ncbi:HNH endonuclease [Bacillus sp. JKS001846]|uniref:HNH endonuclease n=1 Tax=Bacillus sp. JKS001846 TaxID=1938743 RepID=UPI0009D8D110|nr:HNH endonuclease [Bacillus sp. JKS001846]SMD41421.1 TIGR02646 family protein [Bacillus sp. JKS001846]
MERIKIKQPVRTHTGEIWRTNKSNKKYLAKDFDNKCAYCDDLDIYSGGYNVYHVEHFAPKEKFKELEFTYDNLLYSCPYCNISKSNKWIGSSPKENIIGNKGFIDPCTDEYYKHLERNMEGKIIYKTLLGKYMYEELKLYLKRHKIFYNLEKIRIKKNLLKEKIVEKKNKNEDYVELEEFYKELCVVFCEYYDLIFEEDFELIS